MSSALRSRSSITDTTGSVAAVPGQASSDHTTTDTAGPQQGSREHRRARQPQLGLASIEKRNRAQLVPHYLTAGLVALAGAMRQAEMPAHAVPSAAVLAGVGTASASAVGYLWLRKRNRLLSGWNAWYVAVAAAASVWMVLAVAIGVTWGSLAVALAAEYAFGTRWWKRHRHPQAVEPQPDTDVEVDDTFIATLIGRWADNIGNPEGVLPGSRLIPGEQFAHGIEFLVHLVGGKQSIDTVRTHIGMIATGLDHPSSRLVAEAYTDADGEERPSLVRLTVVATSPIKDSVFFREVPTLHKGFLPVGPYSDGRGEASYRLYKGRRMLNGLVVGGTDSGKSRLLEQIGLIAMRSGYTYVIHVDGMNGASCPALWEHAHERYGRNDLDTVLTRLEGMQTYREGQLQTGAFRPTPHYPGVLVIVDEFHRLLPTRTAQDQWANLAREVNKCGIGILGADQDATKKTWGEGVLRASLQSGNCIGLRIKERTAGQIMDGGGFNLFNLPKRSGTGYVFDADEAGAREAMYRGRFIPDYDDAYPEHEDTAVRTSTRQVPDDVPLIEEWFAATDRITLDEGTDQAGGSSVSTAGGDHGSTDTAPQRRPGRQEPSSVALTPMALPTIAPPAAPEATPESDCAPASGADLSSLSDRQYQVYDAVTLGIAQPGQIAEQLGLSRQRVGTVLGELAEHGLVTKSGAGKAVTYTAVPEQTAV